MEIIIVRVVDRAILGKEGDDHLLTRVRGKVDQLRHQGVRNANGVRGIVRVQGTVGRTAIGGDHYAHLIISALHGT